MFEPKDYGGAVLILILILRPATPPASAASLGHRLTALAERDD